MQRQRPYELQPVTLEQKRLLVATYQYTGNMSLSMRTAGIKSPRTAYLWWHRFCEEGEAGLQTRSHARLMQQRLPDEIATSICELRRVHPTWGRRRIADTLLTLYGSRVASPATVEGVLRQANLWEQTEERFLQDAWLENPLNSSLWTTSGVVDEDAVLTWIKHGLAVSGSGDAQRSQLLLQERIWKPLYKKPHEWMRLMHTPNMGKWLLRSRVVLAHSLMNTGRWRQARSVLETTLHWMRENENWLRQQSWEDEASLNFRWSDAWVECHQYLGIVLQLEDYERAQGYLHTALIGLQRQWKPIRPKAPTAMVSNVRRDIVALKIRYGKAADREIAQDLDHIVEGLDPIFLGPGKVAGIAILRAAFYAHQATASGTERPTTRVGAFDHMQQSVEQVISLVQQEPSPMLRANFLADAAQLYDEQGLLFDARLVAESARLCVAYGYRRQAEQLLNWPGIGQCIPPEMLHQLIRLAL